MKIGSYVYDEETLKTRHVKDNKTRFYWINVPEVNEKGLGFFWNRGVKAVAFFLLWKHN